MFGRDARARRAPPHRLAAAAAPAPAGSAPRGRLAGTSAIPRSERSEPPYMTDIVSASLRPSLSPIWPKQAVGGLPRNCDRAFGDSPAPEPPHAAWPLAEPHRGGAFPQ